MASSEPPPLMLPLFSTRTLPPPLHSPEHPGMATPPLYTSAASVPFTWEEEPGKPRPCTALIPHPNPEPKTLDPPPRLFSDSSRPPPAKTPSPNTVLDGPYLTTRPKFTSSSFRIFRHRRQESFDSVGSRSPGREWESSVSSAAPEVSVKKKPKRKGLFPAWGQRSTKSGKKEIVVFPFGSDIEAGSYDPTVRMKRNGSLSSLSQSKPHFWTSVYEGFKQVMPWKSRKPRKGGPVS